MTEAPAFVLEDGAQGADAASLKPDTVTVGAPHAEEVLIEVAASGVCHTDLHVIKDEVAFPKGCSAGA